MGNRRILLLACAILWLITTSGLVGCTGWGSGTSGTDSDRMGTGTGTTRTDPDRRGPGTGRMGTGTGTMGTGGSISR